MLELTILKFTNAGLLSTGDMRQHGSMCSYYTIFSRFLLYIKFDIVHMFLILDFRLTLVLLTMLNQLTCLVYWM